MKQISLTVANKPTKNSIIVEWEHITRTVWQKLRIIFLHMEQEPSSYMPKEDDIKQSVWHYVHLPSQPQPKDTMNYHQVKTASTPQKKITGIEDEITCSDWHTQECPCFILAEENQSGLTETPKWEPRARTGVYLGHSPTHADNVALVFNLIISHVSPQYHVVFDDKFATVNYLNSTESPPSWSNLCQNPSEKVTDEQYNLTRT